jgi:CrcB protein
MASYIWIAIGGALGSVARYWCAAVSVSFFGAAFPFGTLIVNVLGSFVIGVVAALTGPEGRLPMGLTARQFVMVGLCGGYTTFSSFSLETLNLMQGGEWGRAGTNIGLSVTCCLIAVWAGYALAASLSPVKGV